MDGYVALTPVRSILSAARAIFGVVRWLDPRSDELVEVATVQRVAVLPSKQTPFPA